MSRFGTVLRGYLHSPDTRALLRVRRTYRNWPTVLLARVGLRDYPVKARRRLGDEVVLRKHGDVDLLSHPEARERPRGVELHLSGRHLTFETEYTGVLCDTYFRGLYATLPVANRGVLDLGALDGDTAIYFRLHGAAHVVAVEVDPAAANRLRSNLLNNEIDGVTVLEERAVRIEPYIDQLDRSCPSGSETALTLKMDIEGDEEALLEQSSDAAIMRFNDIVLEYHHGPDRCLSRLRGLGYRLHWESPLRHSDGLLCGLIWAERDSSHH